jgi:hypothetical protein
MIVRGDKKANSGFYLVFYRFSVSVEFCAESPLHGPCSGNLLLPDNGVRTYEKYSWANVHYLLPVESIQHLALFLPPKIITEADSHFNSLHVFLRLAKQRCTYGRNKSE